MLTYPFCIKQDSYSITPDDGVLSDDLEGGEPRFESDVLGGVWQSSCTTLLKDPLERQKFWAFYRYWQKEPSKPFLVSLIGNSGGFEEHKCWFVPNSVSVSGFSGQTCQASFQLYVCQNENDDRVDGAVILGLGKIMNPLDHTVNVVLPRELKA